MNIEELAKKMYDAYCNGVGGVAFNGDKLPGSEEFFNDPTKIKQANGWRESATAAAHYFNEGVKIT